jgi:hypothetical protein
MYRYGLPLGCLCLAVAPAGCVLAVWLLGSVWAGAGTAALFSYAGVMSIRAFERAPPPV